MGADEIAPKLGEREKQRGGIGTARARDDNAHITNVMAAEELPHGLNDHAER